VIEKDLDRGYDYRCILHHSMPLDAVVKGCVGNANLLLHMKNSHGFVPANQGPRSKKDKQQFFSPHKPLVSFDETSRLVLDMIIRDLRPFAITEGAGFAKMLEGFGKNYMCLL
jgi:hypothetical protein